MEEAKRNPDGKEEESEYENEEEEKERLEKEQYYDENGKYIWGKEGEDWEFYYQEDKEAFQRGDRSVHPGVLNPPV